MMRFFHRHLDPSACMSELLFGIIMTLTFTLGAGLVIKEGPDATRELLLGVIGCNIAWGVIDGLLYIFGAMYERGYSFRAATLIASKGRVAAGAKLEKYLEDTYGATISPATRSAVSREMIDTLATTEPTPVTMLKEDVYGALVTFVLVALTSVPAVLPFLILDRHLVALRVSNLLLVGLMFLVGWRWAAYINANRWRVGLGMVAGGLVLVQLTIMLGG